MTRNFSLQLLVTVAAVLFLLSPATVSAQAPTVHELHLTPNVPSIDLDLRGMGLAPSHGGYQLTVVSPPAFGLLVGESYSPNAEFWSAEVDQMTLEIQPTGGGVVTQHTLVLIPATPVVVASTTEDFAAATIPSSAVTGNQTMMSLVDPGIDGQSLQVYLHTAGLSADFENFHHYSDNDGNHGIGAAGTTIPGPPDNVVTGSVNLVAAGPIDSTQPPQIYIQLRLRDDGGQSIYEMRAATAPNGNPQCSSCATPWQVVPANQAVRYQLWAGPKVIEGSIARDYALSFSLDLPAPYADTVDWLPGQFDIQRARHGLYQPDGMTYLEATFDNLITWTENYSSTSQIIAQDHFEDTSSNGPWTIDGPIVVNGSGAINGFYGAEADIAQLRSGTPRDAVLTKTTAAAYRGLAVDMEVDLSQLNLDNGESMRLFAASDDPQDLSVKTHLSIVLLRQSGSYKIWARARDDNATVHKTLTHTLMTETPRLSLSWTSRDAASGGGSLAFFVDGVSVGEITGFDNGGPLREIENVGFGVFNPNLNSVNVNPSHLLLLDDIVVVQRP